MNKEYIEREAVVKLREEFWKDRCDYMAVRVTNIMNIPAADVAPVRHGEWIEYSGDPNIITCSECDWGEPPISKKYKRCPNCGARMDRGK